MVRRFVLDAIVLHGFELEETTWKRSLYDAIDLDEVRVVIKPVVVKNLIRRVVSVVDFRIRFGLVGI